MDDEQQQAQEGGEQAHCCDGRRERARHGRALQRRRDGLHRGELCQLNSDGTVASFNGATGSNTISSLTGGINIFNHASVGYTDGSGAFHVLVIGGDDVNAPGTKHTGVFFY